MELEMATKMVNQLTNSKSGIRRTFYANCWHLGDHESEAMWLLYCGVTEGVALVLPYARLRDSLHNDDLTYMGTVKYIDYNTEVISPNNAFNVVMRKRREFEHEREARIVCWRPPASEDWSPADLAPSITLEWPPEEHLQKIVVSP
jgi:hypothetical protein